MYLSCKMLTSLMYGYFIVVSVWCRGEVLRVYSDQGEVKVRGLDYAYRAIHRWTSLRSLPKYALAYPVQVSSPNDTDTTTSYRWSRGADKAVDPRSFFADPDPAVFLNAYPDPVDFSMTIRIHLF